MKTDERAACNTRNTGMVDATKLSEQLPIPQAYKYENNYFGNLRAMIYYY